MKKISLLIITFIMLVSLSSCGPEGEVLSEEKQQEAEEIYQTFEDNLKGSSSYEYRSENIIFIRDKFNNYHYKEENDDENLKLYIIDDVITLFIDNVLIEDEETIQTYYSAFLSFKEYHIDEFNFDFLDGNSSGTWLEVEDGYCYRDKNDTMDYYEYYMNFDGDKYEYISGNSLGSTPVGIVMGGPGNGDIYNFTIRLEIDREVRLPRNY